MSFRAKLLLAQAPLVVALLVSGVAGSMVTAALGRSADAILKDNYRSILAAERMKEAIERLDHSSLMALAGTKQASDTSEERAQARFEEELSTQERNITEAGEARATRQLRVAFTVYRAAHAAFLGETDPAQRRTHYLGRLLPALTDVRKAADAILALNQDAMMRKSERARRGALEFNRALITVAALGCVLGVWMSTLLTLRLLRPLSALSLAARRIGEGDLDVRAIPIGKDEIAALAHEFNVMAQRLKSYRDSSLGELLEARQSSQAAIDSLPDPVLVLSVDRKLVHLNVAAEQLMRLSRSQAHVLAALPKRLRAVIEQVHEHVLRGKGSSRLGLKDAVRISTQDGERDVLARAAPVHSEDGAVIGTTIVLQDVSRQLRVDELKNDLVATVAHEFRTPLTSIRMALYLLAEQKVGGLTEKQADLLFAARDDCERLQTIVEELLDLSRIQAGRVALETVALDADALVRSALEAQQATATELGVTIRSAAFPGLGQVHADPERAQLVIGNLLANAVRHSPIGASVEVRTAREGAFIRFEVHDDGPGIPSEFQDAIFDKHVQLPGRSGGAGLGLFIAREIVHAHGGAIGVTSSGGAGSTFWFTLPLCPTPP